MKHKDKRLNSLLPWEIIVGSHGVIEIPHREPLTKQNHLPHFPLLELDWKSPLRTLMLQAWSPGWVVLSGLVEPFRGNVYGESLRNWGMSVKGTVGFWHLTPPHSFLLPSHEVSSSVLSHIPAMMSCPTTGPGAMEPIHHGLKHLKLWAKKPTPFIRHFIRHFISQVFVSDRSRPNILPMVALCSITSGLNTIMLKQWCAHLCVCMCLILHNVITYTTTNTT